MAFLRQIYVLWLLAGKSHCVWWAFACFLLSLIAFNVYGRSFPRPITVNASLKKSVYTIGKGMFVMSLAMFLFLMTDT